MQYPEKNALLVGVHNGRFVPVATDGNGRLCIGSGSTNGVSAAMYPSEVVLAMGVSGGRYVPLAVDEFGNVQSSGDGGSGDGGTSDHAALTHLAYADAGHTGFAGTEIENTFTEQQTFQSPIPALDAEMLTNPSFASGLTGWTADAGWAGSGGAAVHTPGTSDELYQAVEFVEGELYYIEITIAGPAGYVEIYFDNANADIEADGVTGTVSGVAVGRATGADAFYVFADSDFAGSITSASVRHITGAIEPTVIFASSDGQPSIEVRPGRLGYFNFFIGKNAGAAITDGQYNLALGTNALPANTEGSYNLAIGNEALKSNTDQSGNVAIGNQAMFSNTAGSQNLALGGSALYSNVSGATNVAIGESALGQNTDGGNNTAVGRNAGGAANNDGCVYIGLEAGRDNNADNQLFIGNNATTPLISGTMDADPANQVVTLAALKVILPNLPTSSAGLPAGALWKSAGVLMIA